MDFNSKASLSGRLSALVDQALEAERDASHPRQYLGASRIGAPCERQLQYEYAKAPVDAGKSNVFCKSWTLTKYFFANHIFNP